MTTPGDLPVRPPSADPADGPILVTGAAGEVGHGLLSALVGSGRSVVAVDRRPLDPAVVAVCTASAVADVTDADAMQRLVEEHDIGGIVHLAAMLSTSAERDPDAALRVNVHATTDLLRIATERGRRIERRIPFLLPSSIAVFGLPDRATKDAAGALDEGAHLDPITMYGCTKLACEHFGRYHARHHRLLDGPAPGGIDFRVIRYPGLISGETVPTGGTSDFAPEMIHAAAQGRPYACFVDAEARIPFMTMGEAIEATLQLMDAPAADLQQTAYNVASFAPTAGEIRAAVLEHHPGAEITFRPDALRASIVDSWPADLDTAAARRDFGFAPRHDLGSALRDELLPAISARYAGDPATA